MSPYGEYSRPIFSRYDPDISSTVIEWEWFLFNGFGGPSGYSLSNAGNLAKILDKEGENYKAILVQRVVFQSF